MKEKALPLQNQASGHVAEFFALSGAICGKIELSRIEALAAALGALRERGGRLFMLGVGGSAGNCSHAVNDFRKLCGIEAYSPVDNVAELTARANDEGWETIFAGWLEVSRLSERDAIFVLSVGGGDVERNVSINLVRAVDFARSRGAKVFGIVGKEAGYTARNGDVVVAIPEVKAGMGDPALGGLSGRGMALSRQPSGAAGSEDQVVTGATRPRRAVFLDRDGVLVIPEIRDGRSYAPRSIGAFKIYPSAAESLARLKAAGYLLVVVTNQPDIGNGLVSVDVVNEMHRLMAQALPIDRIEMCPHSQSEACGCRKPKPQMLLDAARRCGNRSRGKCNGG